MSDAEVAKAMADARAAKNKGDLDTALKLCSQVLKARPEDAQANYFAAWILAEKDDTALAIGQFERAMKLGLTSEQMKEAQAALKRLKAREQ
jgi:tetratricopeptide (TPR) repeat protein